MRGAESADDEHWVLTTDAGQSLAAEVAKIQTPRPADLARWRTTATVGHVAAAIRLVESRRRGAAKFDRADRMWFERTGLEQATSESVARHKARRFSGRAEIVFDLCCGVGGDAIALAAETEVVAVDADQGMCRRTLWNAGIYNVRDRVIAVRSRAEGVLIPDRAWVHVDPDRRAKDSNRARRLEDYVPGLEFLLTLPHQAVGGAIKLSPASDFDRHFPSERFEIELLSLDGECKEATIWFGAAVTCRRRATCLPDGTTWTDADGPARAYAAAGPVGAWVFDPDPALVRAGLLDGFAAVHGLTRIAAGIDFLTAPRRVESPFLAAFEVLAVLSLDMKTLKREVQARCLGPLEVKTKGLKLRPEEVRSQLRPPGGEPATLLLAGGQGPALAVLARRVPT